MDGADAHPETGSRWADLGGPVHYVDHGGPDGAPLLLLVHGLGGSHLNWMLTAPELTKTFRAVAIDLPAHGRTPAAGRSGTIAANRHLLQRFITEVLDEPVVLVGNSMGGMLSILQAAAHPQTVTAVALLDPALPQSPLTRPDPLVLTLFAGYSFPRVGELLLRGRSRQFTVEDMVNQTLRLCCAYPDRIPPEVVQAAIELARERSQHPGADAGFLDAARSLLRVLWRPARYWRAMASIQAPVLLLHGARDRLVPIAAARRAARLNPGWRFEVRDDVGHVPQLEDPAWTVDLLNEWLAAHADRLAANPAPRQV